MLKMNLILLIFNLLLTFTFISSTTHTYTTTMETTTGAPWPKPSFMQVKTDSFLVPEETFRFIPIGSPCDTLLSAFKRYYRRIFPGSLYPKFQQKKSIEGQNVLTGLSVSVVENCTNKPYPFYQANESYELTVASGDQSILHAPNIWGALRGLHTFSQLVYESRDGGFYVNSTVISDSPRFSHRGILLDTARHFLPVDTLKKALDSFEMNKMNVLHWHIVDDQSFPYYSLAFPNITLKGAYDSRTHVYTREDIEELVEYARERGVRIIPEFDTPGHTRSWGHGAPGLLTECYSGGKPNGAYGPMDPTSAYTYDVMQAVMKEVIALFPDVYIHLGGDEVSFDCWKSNPDIQKFMIEHKFGDDYGKLEEYYIVKLLEIVKSLGGKYIIWQEPVDNGVVVAPDTVVEVWRPNPFPELQFVTKKGLSAILSSPWYLNRISYADDWIPYYLVEPLSFNGTSAQKELVIGGEACIWGEYVDQTNLLSRLWPRASAVAERLWSVSSVRDHYEAAPRLNEQRCRLVRQGIPAEPVNGPGFCKHSL